VTPEPFADYLAQRVYNTFSTSNEERQADDEEE